MKKLGKKISAKMDTLQAYACGCTSSCLYKCTAGIPDYAPELSISSSQRA